jgi:CBS domain-containing protein
MALEEIVRKPARTIEPGRTLVEAAQEMIRHSVGALVISDAADAEPTGIVTDRDLVVMLAEGLDPETATVDCLVKAPLTTVPLSATLRETTELMRKAGVRRLPVLDAAGRLLGLVSLDDVLRTLGRELSDLAMAVTEELEHERAISAIRGSAE